MTSSPVWPRSPDGQGSPDRPTASEDEFVVILITINAMGWFLWHKRSQSLMRGQDSGDLVAGGRSGRAGLSGL